MCTEYRRPTTTFIIHSRSQYPIPPYPLPSICPRSRTSTAQPLLRLQAWRITTSKDQARQSYSHQKMKRRKAETKRCANRHKLERRTRPIIIFPSPRNPNPFPDFFSSIHLSLQGPGPLPFQFHFQSLLPPSPPLLYSFLLTAAQQSKHQRTALPSSSLRLCKRGACLTHSDTFSDSPPEINL